MPSNPSADSYPVLKQSDCHLAFKFPAAPAWEFIMITKKRWLIIQTIVIVILLFGTGLAFSALKAGYKKAIEIAFMNGYVEALKQDVDEITKLKENRKLLKERVKAASARYVEMVNRLNAARGEGTPMG